MLAEKLNGDVKIVSKNQGVNVKIPDVEFYDCSVEEGISKMVSSFSPYGKVGYVTTFESGLKYCTKLAKTVRKTGAVMATLIMEDLDVTIDNLSRLFSFPEDVRLIIVTDAVIVPFALYYCSLRGVPLVIIPSSMNVKGILKNKVYVKTQDKIDAVNVKVKRHVVIDVNFIDDKLHSAYAHVMSKLTSLIDYRLSRVLLQKSTAKSPYDLVRQSVINTFSADFSDEQIKEILLYNSFKVELASLVTRGDLCDLSSSNIALLLENKEYSPDLELLFSLRIIKLYELLSSNVADFMALTDFNSLSQVLSDKTGIKDTSFIKNYQKQGQMIDKNVEKVKTALSNMKDEISSFSSLQDKILENYRSLGGKIEKADDFSFSLMHSGDYFVGINGVTLAREMKLFYKV